MSDFPTVAFIGPGNAGVSIARSARQAGYPVVAVGGRDPQKCRQAVTLINEAASPDGPIEALDVATAAARASIVFLTVSDRAIQPLCEELAQTSAFMKGAVVAHVSGVLESNILISAKQKCGCLIASAHPLQTFAFARSSKVLLPGTCWFMEGDTRALETLSNFVATLGCTPCTILPGQKPLYHAASVVASNYLTTLIDVALSILEKAGIDRPAGLEALRPLIESAITNTLAIGTDKALTGPISRGDAGTLIQHIKALKKNNPSFIDIYQALGRHTVALGRRTGSINVKQAEELISALSGSD